MIAACRHARSPSLWSWRRCALRSPQTNRRIAIDLPLRALAWEDDAGKVWIGYSRPETLKSRYKSEGRDDVLKTMTGALEAFTTAATR